MLTVGRRRKLGSTANRKVKGRTEKILPLRMLCIAAVLGLIWLSARPASSQESASPTPVGTVPTPRPSPGGIPADLPRIETQSFLGTLIDIDGAKHPELIPEYDAWTGVFRRLHSDKSKPDVWELTIGQLRRSCLSSGGKGRRHHPAPLYATLFVA